jgi:hypothetical protein
MLSGTVRLSLCDRLVTCNCGRWMSGANAYNVGSYTMHDSCYAFLDSPEQFTHPPIAHSDLSAASMPWRMDLVAMSQDLFQTDSRDWGICELCQMCQTSWQEV